MEFPGVLKKEHVEIPGVNSKRSGISSSDCEKGVQHNFVEYPKVKFCFLYNFQEKCDNFKNSRSFSKKYVFTPSPI